MGQVHFPLVMMVTPKALPLPFGLATMTWLLVQVALVFQVELILSGEGTFMVTIHWLEPETATLRL